MSEVFFSRSSAATAAMRKGLKAFETFRPLPSDNTCWTYEARPVGPGIEYAQLFAQDKDWIHHVEIDSKLIPILVVTCFREEIIEEIPTLFRIEPITPELWEAARREYPNPSRYIRKPVMNGHSEPTAQPQPRPVAKPNGEHKRVAGATGICKEIMLANPELAKDKQAFVNMCLARGVILATASTQWYRLR